MFLLSDVTSVKLKDWETISRDFPYSPLQTKAFHIMGTLFQNFEAAGHLLRIDRKVQADFYLQAYLLACTSLEFLGCCLMNAQTPRINLEKGLDYAGLTNISTRGITYTIEDLVALRNLAAHGQCQDYQNTSRIVVLHIDLLNSFPEKLLLAYKKYYDSLLNEQEARQQLADCIIEPYIHYKMVSGKALRNPVDYGCKKLKEIYEEKEDIMEVFATSRNWTVNHKADDKSHEVS